MVRPASKIFVKFAAATAVSAVLILGILGLRLLAGPVSLAPIQPIVEAVLNDTLSRYRVRLGETQVAWSRSEQKLDLLVKNAELRGLDGRVLALVPEMAVRFSAGALAHGMLAPGRVELIGPSATLVRRVDGGFQFGFSAPGSDQVAEGTTGFLSGLVSDLRGGGSGTAQLGYLNRLTIKSANLTLYDAATGSVWHAPNSLIGFTRTKDGLQARLDTRIATDTGRFRVTGSAMLAHRAQDTTVTLSLSGLNPSELATSAPFQSLAGVNVPVRGDAMLRVDAAGRVTEGAFWLFAGAGPFAMPGLPSVALALAAAEVKGTYNAARNEVTLERLSYEGHGNSGLVTGKAVLDRNEKGTISGAEFDLTAKDVVLDMPTLFTEPGRIDSVALRGHIDPSAMHLDLDKAELHAGEAVLAVKGDVDDGPDGVGLRLEGTIARFAIAQFAKLWPLGPGQGARDWIVENVSSGVIRNGTLKVDAAPGELALDRLPEKAVQLSFSYDGMTIDYLHGLTPITGGAGRAKLTGNRFELAMERGAVGSLVLTEGRYVVPDLSDKEVPAEIAVRLNGETGALLAVLDMQPLGYPSSYGFRPQDVGGSSDARIGLTLPMKKEVRFADIALEANVEAADFTLPGLYRDVGIEGGRLTAAITNDGLRAKGDLLIAGISAKVAWAEEFHAEGKPSTQLKLSGVLDDPARKAVRLPFADQIQGPVPVTLAIEGRAKAVSRVVVDCDLGGAALQLDALNWSKYRHAPASAHAALLFPKDGRILVEDIALQGSGLDIKGKLAFGRDGTIESAALNPLKAGPGTNGRLQLAREGATRVVTLEGDRLDLSKNIGTLIDTLKTSDGAPNPPLKLKAKLRRLALAHGIALTDLDAHYASPGYGISDLTLNAGYEDGGFVSARIEKDGAKRWLRVRSADMGKLLSGLDLTSHLQGGSLILDASLPPAGVTPVKEPLTGTASLKGFRVKDAPALAKLLTVASFGGIRDLLSGEGIAFESLDTPFTIVSDRIALGPGRAFGPSIGLTLQGEVARGTGDLDLSGTLVPAYSINTFLGNVPVIGNIFVSREGEGVIGMTYAVKGDAGDPRVLVNPLSALAPGFLRRIFQLDEADSAERTGATPTQPVTPR